jgi:hypothetical protein
MSRLMLADCRMRGKRTSLNHKKPTDDALGSAVDCRDSIHTQITSKVPPHCWWRWETNFS